ncbi:hypothetical protein B5X24_HaOG207398 [Helicoverpa armigera]|uniref:Uncharacterized protein n=1 Tax=Helicoverpa armigera TaxID=29058 RepID=A0A2W1BHV6_HELAM|nr:hypothetical protein B5X24_HaOG207398 [Helicoverpa armigera]
MPGDKNVLCSRLASESARQRRGRAGAVPHSRVSCRVASRARRSPPWPRPPSRKRLAWALRAARAARTRSLRWQPQRPLHDCRPVPRVAIHYELCTGATHRRRRSGAGADMKFELVKIQLEAPSMRPPSAPYRDMRSSHAHS